MFCEFLPFGSGVDGLSVDSTYDESSISYANLGADCFVVVEGLPAFVRGDGLFLEHNGTLTVVLVLRSDTAFVYFVFSVND